MLTTEKKKEFPAAFLAGLLVVAGLVSILFLLSRDTGPAAPPPARLPMAEADRPYAAKITFSGIRMARATNMLNHEITYISGIMQNTGDRTVASVEVAVEFRNSMDQVVLREFQRPLGWGQPAPLGPGQTREFTFTFESVPADWNIQYPKFVVTGLTLQ